MRLGSRRSPPPRKGKSGSPSPRRLLRYQGSATMAAGRQRAARSRIALCGPARRPTQTTRNVIATIVPKEVYLDPRLSPVHKPDRASHLVSRLAFQRNAKETAARSIAPTAKSTLPVLAHSGRTGMVKIVPTATQPEPRETNRSANEKISEPKTSSHPSSISCGKASEPRPIPKAKSISGVRGRLRYQRDIEGK